MSNLLILINILGKQKWKYLVSAILLIIVIFMRMLEPKLLQSVIDSIVYVRGKDMLETNTVNKDAVTNIIFSLLPEINTANISKIFILLGLMFFLVTLTRSCIYILSVSIVASSSEKAIKNLRERIFYHIQFLPVSFFARIPKGELIQRSTGDVDKVWNFFQNHLIELIRLLFMFVFAFLMMCIVNLKFALISISLTPFIALGGYWYFNKVAKIWRKHEKEADKLNARIQENLSGMATVKAFANEPHEISMFKSQHVKKRKVGMQMVGINSFYWPLSNFIIYVQFAISIVAGGYFVLNQTISIGQLVATYFYFNMLAMPLRFLGRIISNMSMSLVAVRRINNVLNTPKENYNKNGHEDALAGHIEFRNVSFRYPNENKYALKDLNFKITPGETVAFIGPVGAGKSTLLKLLLRFYDDYTGDIYLDGRNIKEYAKSSLRKKLGVSFQMPFLFSTHIEENLTYSNPDISIKKIQNATNIACIDELYDTLPEGLKSRVGEKGIMLSGGQKQRITIARAILAEPDIFIFDDITSAVDAETENEIFSKLFSYIGDKTTLIISHRITSLKWADKIIALDNGKVIQTGTLKDLIDVPGYLKDIIGIQSLHYQEQDL